MLTGTVYHCKLQLSMANSLSFTLSNRQSYAILLVGDSMQLHESGENYLEAILALSERGPVRSIDVAQYLGFSKPSVSRAMSLLRENGYVAVNEIGLLSLTEAGLAVAASIYERHRLLTRWLTMLGVSPQVAAEDACKIEHDLSQESFEAIKRHIQRHDTHE